MLARPSPKARMTVRLVHDSNQVVQWGILFPRKIMTSHLLDEAIRWTVGSLLQGRKAEDLIEAAVEGSGEWMLDRIYSIERVAFDERPEDLGDLAPRRDRAEVHSIMVDEWGEGDEPPPFGGGSDDGGWGSPGGRLS